MKLLLICFSAFALFCHVHAGFCDGQSGRYCRYKDGLQVSTWCSCKYKSKRRFLSKDKYKSKSSSLKRDCDNIGDTPCTNGCGSGYCLAANKVCAKTTLDNVAWNDGQKVHSLTTTCPMVTKFPYKTWKDRQENTDAKEMEYLKMTVNANKAWSKANLLLKFNSSGAQGFSAMEKAWDVNCKATDVQQMNCRSYFPKCVNNVGANSECMAHCQSVMLCVTKVQGACVNANKAAPMKCNQFANFGPRGGLVNCVKLCQEHQNDYVDAGSTLGSFMSVAIAFAITFIM